MRFMANDRAIGGGILIGSLAGIVIYAILLWYWGPLIVEITAFIAVAVLLGILAWIGYTMATTPPPEPITDIPEMAPEKPASDTGSTPAAKKE